MALRTSVEVEAGRPVVRRLATGEDVERLRRRAAGLTEAAGPGVAAVVRDGPTAHGGWELVTAHAGLPLDPGRVVCGARLAAIGARVADTLARRHAEGAVVGALELDDLAIGADGLPVLCAVPSTVASAADDVAALGRVLRGLASLLPPDEGLAGVLARACDEDPERRPTARRLAADLAAVAAPPGRPRAVPLRAGAAALVLCGAISLVILRGGAPSSRPPHRAAVTVTTPVPTSTASTLPVCVAAAGRPVGRGEACPAEVVVTAGAVEVDGHRAVVGRTGDEVLVGDWACEGLRPAVLRPATGEVLVYAATEPGRPPVVAQAERVEGATGLAARTEPDGCPALLVVTPAGSVPLT